MRRKNPGEILKQSQWDGKSSRFQSQNRVVLKAKSSRSFSRRTRHREFDEPIAWKPDWLKFFHADDVNARAPDLGGVSLLCSVFTDGTDIFC